jgi:adenine phosphoribosyltransferase
MPMDLRQFVLDVPDFPRPGILFRDISPLLADAAAFAAAIRALAAAVADLRFDAIAGIEARGFIFGAALARELDRGFIAVRKHGKLPGAVHRASYALEYGEDVLELRAGVLAPGARVLLVDDVLATGGTLDAARRLALEAGLHPVAALVLVELSALGGRARLDAALPVRGVIAY